MRKFTTKRKEEEFEVELEDGSIEKYVMREYAGTERDNYNEAMRKRMRIAPDGKPAGLQSIKGMDADLLCSCVFNAETGKPVTKAEVDAWPSSMLEEIGNWALEFNSLDKKAEDKAKNDSSGRDGSGGE